MPIGITYNSTSILNNIDYLDASISTLLTEYMEGEYIESVLTLTILNGTLVECSFSNIISEQTFVFSNTSGMNFPSLTDVKPMQLIKYSVCLR